MKSQVTALSPVYGLKDLIAGQTPTYVDWTVDPTDGADITDGDKTTTCTTGSKNATAWQAAEFEWMFGQYEDVLVTGCGYILTTAGNIDIYISCHIDGAWIRTRPPAVQESRHDDARVYHSISAHCDGIRLMLQARANTTIMPGIRELHAWRLK